jgi:hypothetical protein
MSSNDEEREVEWESGGFEGGRGGGGRWVDWPSVG